MRVSDSLREACNVFGIDHNKIINEAIVDSDRFYARLLELKKNFFVSSVHGRVKVAVLYNALISYSGIIPRFVSTEGKNIVFDLPVEAFTDITRLVGSGYNTIFFGNRFSDDYWDDVSDDVIVEDFLNVLIPVIGAKYFVDNRLLFPEEKSGGRNLKMFISGEKFYGQVNDGFDVGVFVYVLKFKNRLNTLFQDGLIDLLSENGK